MAVQCPVPRHTVLPALQTLPVLLIGTGKLAVADVRSKTLHQRSSFLSEEVPNRKNLSLSSSFHCGQR